MKDATTAQLLAGVKRDQAQNDARKTTDEPLAAAETAMRDARRMAREFPTAHQEAIEALLEVIRRQDARIAALEAARAPLTNEIEGGGPNA